MNFKDWFKEQGFAENMWGNIPCKTRKPSDGWGGNKGGAGAAMPAQQMGAPKMMKKKMKK
jgi:hypothetical protein